MQVMVIEPCFADRHDFWCREQLAEARGGLSGPGSRFVRMNAGRGGKTPLRAAAGERGCAFTPAHGFPDHDDVRDAGRRGAREHCVAVRVECRVTEMAVRVD